LSGAIPTPVRPLNATWPTEAVNARDHRDGSRRVCEPVEYHLEDVALKRAWTGSAALALTPRAQAPVAEPVVVEVVSALSILADLTLGLGKAAHDYLSQPIEPSALRAERTHSF